MATLSTARELEILKYSNYILDKNSQVAKDSELFVFTVKDVLQRVALFLNIKSVPAELNTIVARIVVGVYRATQDNIGSERIDREVHRITDNGQSITYMASAKNYLTTTSDNNLFMGFEQLLEPYREVRTNVVA